MAEDPAPQLRRFLILADAHLMARAHQLFGHEFLTKQGPQRERAHILQTRHVLAQLFRMLLSQYLRFRRSFGRQRTAGSGHELTDSRIFQGKRAAMYPPTELPTT